MSLWLIPALCGLLAFSLAITLTWVDRNRGRAPIPWFLYSGHAASARQVLSTIASSMITLTGVVFSITILVLQVASSQYSPRILRTFFENRKSKLAMGVFIAAFVYAMAVLPEVRESLPDRPGFVPALSITVAYVLVLIATAVFVGYIHHMAHSIRAIHVVRTVASDGLESIEHLYPQSVGEPGHEARDEPIGPPDRLVINPQRGGVVAAVDEQRLMRTAVDCGAVIEVVPMHGDYVPRGGLVLRVWGKVRHEDRVLSRMVTIGAERTPRQDPAFSVRQLVDIAERALSPGVNDPTTAVQAIDQIHELLRAIGVRPFPPSARRDEGGHLRLILPTPDWESYVSLALVEIRQYGCRSIQVMRRLRSMLDDLIETVPEARRAPLIAQLRQVQQAVGRSFDDAADRALAEAGNSQGQGGGA